MQQYKEGNLNFLRREYPRLYEQYTQMDLEYNDTFIELSKSGDPNVKFYVNETSNYMYSVYDPKKEAEKWLNQVGQEMENPKNILLFGLGLGYHLDAIVDRYPKCKIYILEPNPEVFYRYIEARNMKPLLGRGNIVSLAVGSDEKVLYNFSNVIANHVKDELLTWIVPFYQREFRFVYQQLMKKVEYVLQSYKTELATHLLFESDWPRNCILNMPEYIQTPDISFFQDKFKNIPAIIVGSGPSLTDDIESLGKLKGRCLVIAAGSSIQALTFNNILPDLVVSIDGGEANYTAFANVNLSNIPLLYTPIVHHKIIKKPKANSISFLTSSDTLTPYLLPDNRCTKLLSAATVTASAMQAASVFGCDPIVLVGQDLSYPDNTFYTKGVNHVSEDTLKKIIEEEAQEYVPNVSGGFNKTSSKMKITQSAIEYLVKILNNNFINTSRRGAHIEGTEYMPLESFIDRGKDYSNLKVDLSEEISKVKLNREELIHEGKDRLIQFHGQLNQLNTGVNNFGKIIEDTSVITLKKAQRQIDKINEKWSKIVSMPIFREALAMSTDGHLKIIIKSLPEISDEENIKARLQKMKETFRAIIEALIKLTPRLIEWTEESLQELQAMEKR